MRKLIRSRVLLSVIVAVVAVGAVVALGATYRESRNAAADDEAAAPSTTTATTPPTPTTVFTPPPLVQPAHAELPDVGAGIGQGDSGLVVGAYQQRLADLRFDPGEVDGIFDQPTRHAVEAFQKTIGVEPNGVITQNVAFAIAVYSFNEPLEPYGGANRTEVDIQRQVITVYSDWQVALITTTSTGGGHRYCYSSPRVNPTVRICEDANTPSGRYEFYEYRPGWDPSPLGRLYNPVYFNGGIAIHGFDSVPTAPRSSGCARIPMHIAEYFPDLIAIGDPVYVFGGEDAVVHSRSPLRVGPPPAPPPAHEDPIPAPAPAPVPEPAPPPPEPAPPEPEPVPPEPEPTG